MLSPEQAKNARDRLKVSQSHVARHTGINRTYLSLFEAGKYLLDDEAQSALRSYYEEQGYDFGESEIDDPAEDPVTEGEQGDGLPVGDEETGEGTDGELPPPVIVSADPLINAALTALDDLRMTAASTGLDSKRTAAAVASARSALVQLDYPDLCSLAISAETVLAGFPAMESFRELPIGEKEAWEERAVSVLVCAALYQAQWAEGDCATWRNIGVTLVQQEFLEEDARPLRTISGLLGDRKANQDYLERARSYLAPALLRAAEQRRTVCLKPV